MSYIKYAQLPTEIPELVAVPTWTSSRPQRALAYGTLGASAGLGFLTGGLAGKAFAGDEGILPGAVLGTVVGAVVGPLLYYHLYGKTPSYVPKEQVPTSDDFPSRILEFLIGNAVTTTLSVGAGVGLLVLFRKLMYPEEDLQNGKTT